MLTRHFPLEEFNKLAKELGWSDSFTSLVSSPNSLIQVLTISKKDIYPCDGCKELLSTENYTIHLTSRYLHLKCADYIKCHYCESKISCKTEGDVTLINGIVTCNDCVVKRTACLHCKNLFFEKELVVDGYCPQCVFNCGGCRKTVPIPKGMTLRSGGGVKICTVCGKRDIYVKRHDFNPLEILNFQGMPKNGIYFGIELEAEAPTTEQAVDIAEKITKKFGKYLCIKHDGSLSNQGKNGIEIVSAPGDYAFHKKIWKEFFEENYALDSNKSERCSTHIHISKAPLKALQQARITYFMYSSGNRSFIEVIAGRSLSTEWAKTYSNIHESLKIENLVEVHGSEQYLKKHFGLSDATDLMLPLSQRECKFINPRFNRARYHALNLENPNTIEMRIFAGTSQYESMLKNVEFCQALVDYCAIGNASYKGLISPKEFLDFISASKSLYPYLVKFLESRKLLKSNLREKIKIKENLVSA